MNRTNEARVRSIPLESLDISVQRQIGTIRGPMLHFKGMGARISDAAAGIGPITAVIASLRSQ